MMVGVAIGCVCVVADALHYHFFPKNIICNMILLGMLEYVT